MKKSSIFLALGTCVLAISAVFATKTNKKFATAVSTGFYKSGSTYVTAFTGNASFGIVTGQVSTYGHAVIKGTLSKTIFYLVGSTYYAAYNGLF